MSLLNQSYSPEFIASLSQDDKVVLVKAIMREYHETHTKEEYGHLVYLLEASVNPRTI
jgi:hypothetical protein